MHGNGPSGIWCGRYAGKLTSLRIMYHQCFTLESYNSCNTEDTGILIISSLCKKKPKRNTCNIEVNIEKSVTVILDYEPTNQAFSFTVKKLVSYVCVVLFLLHSPVFNSRRPPLQA